MAKQDIKQYEFKKGQSGNPNGRPKSRIAEIKRTLLKQKKSEEYKAMSATELNGSKRNTHK